MLTNIPTVDLPFTPPPDRPFRTVPISIRDQLQTEWCWAAVTEAIAAFTGREPPQSQCAIASAVIHTDCCHDGSSDACNLPLHLEAVLRKLKFSVEPQAVVPVEELSQRIANQWAIAIRVGWSDDSGHFLLITGVEDVPNPSDIKDLLIADPIYGSGVCSYEELCKDFLKQDGARWTNTYFTK